MLAAGEKARMVESGMRRMWESEGKGGSGGEGRTVRSPSEMVPMNLQTVAVVRDILSDAQTCDWKRCCGVEADVMGFGGRWRWVN